MHSLQSDSMGLRIILPDRCYSRQELASLEEGFAVGVIMSFKMAEECL